MNPKKACKFTKDKSMQTSTPDGKYPRRRNRAASPQSRQQRVVDAYSARARLLSLSSSWNAQKRFPRMHTQHPLPNASAAARSHAFCIEHAAPALTQASSTGCA